jgi:zinc protease
VTLDRSAPPPPAEARAFRFPPFVRRQLAGGLTLLAARLPRAPLVQLRLLFPAGAAWDPPERAGRAVVTGLLLDEGTEHATAPEVAAAAERLGASLGTGADWDFAFAGIQLLSRHTRAGLDLVAAVATEPSFPAPEVRRILRERKAEVMRRRADPAFLARERFDRVVYGDSPYGLPATGTEETLAGLDRGVVADFYQRHYTLAGAVAVAVGDLDPDRIAVEVERALPAAPGPRPPPPPAVDPLPRQGVEVHLVDRPGAPQTQLLLGHAGVPRRHPDWLPLAVANAILGGKFTSRINLSLRERHGYTYGASSRFEGRLGPGPFTVGAAVANAVAGAAAAEIVVELERIGREPVTPAELEDSKSYLVGVFPYTLQSVAGLAHRLETLAVYGLPDDHYERFPDEVAAVDRERALAAARRHFHPDGLVVVAVGPATELASQFERLGPVWVWAAAGEPAAAVTPGGR